MDRKRARLWLSSLAGITTLACAIGACGTDSATSSQEDAGTDAHAQVQKEAGTADASVDAGLNMPDAPILWDSVCEGNPLAKGCL
jgi:hypothetical protein